MKDKNKKQGGAAQTLLQHPELAVARHGEEKEKKQKRESFDSSSRYFCSVRTWLLIKWRCQGSHRSSLSTSCQTLFRLAASLSSTWKRTGTVTLSCVQSVQKIWKLCSSSFPGSRCTWAAIENAVHAAETVQNNEKTSSKLLHFVS